MIDLYSTINKWAKTDYIAIKYMDNKQMQEITYKEFCIELDRTRQLIASLPNRIALDRKIVV